MQKTFVAAKVLCGFTDEAHRTQLTGEYLADQDAQTQQQQLEAAAAARTFVSTLLPFQPTEIVRRVILGTHVDLLRADPLFQRTLGQRQNQFAYVDLSQLIALQAWIEPRHDHIPTAEDALLAYALPTAWDVPAEVTFIPPAGPIQIMTSSPAMQGVQMEFDAATGTVRLGPPKHLNLIQVIRVAGRSYLLRNA